MTRRTKPRSRRGARRPPPVRTRAPPTAAQRLYSLLRPVCEAKV